MGEPITEYITVDDANKVLRNYDVVMEPTQIEHYLKEKKMLGYGYKYTNIGKFVNSEQISGIYHYNYERKNKVDKNEILYVKTEDIENLKKGKSMMLQYMYVGNNNENDHLVIATNNKDETKQYYYIPDSSKFVQSKTGNYYSSNNIIYCGRYIPNDQNVNTIKCKYEKMEFNVCDRLKFYEGTQKLKDELTRINSQPTTGGKKARKQTRKSKKARKQTRKRRTTRR